MERYTFTHDGVFPVCTEWNTETTTFTAGDIPEGTTIAVGISSSDGWTPLDGGQLSSGVTVCLSHGLDASIQILVSGLVGEVKIDARKGGIPSTYARLAELDSRILETLASVRSLGTAGAITESTYRVEFTGLASEVAVEHNLNRSVFPIFIDLDDIILYPVYTTVDVNNIIVTSNVPLHGTLYLL